MTTTDTTASLALAVAVVAAIAGIGSWRAAVRRRDPRFLRATPDPAAALAAADDDGPSGEAPIILGLTRLFSDCGCPRSMTSACPPQVCAEAGTPPVPACHHVRPFIGDIRW